MISIRIIGLILFINLYLAINGICEGRSTYKYNNPLSFDQDILRCREKCLFKILKSSTKSRPTFDDCSNNPNCFMCWDYCQALILAEADLARSMCSDKEFCSDGCQVACHYHKIKTFHKIILTISSNFV